MILAFDCSTAACSAALIAEDGSVLASADEVIGRGHAERLVPMIAELLAGRRPRRLLVGCGPGSFTGIRVAVAAAHGLAIGWGVPLAGMSSLALIAAGAPVGNGPVGDGPAGGGLLTAVIPGGHGQLFLQTFGRSPIEAAGAPANLAPAEAAGQFPAGMAVGPGAAALAAARGGGPAIALYPSAARALLLGPALRSLEPRPIYARAPDARPLEAA